jgi:cytoskeletal protein RodZ
MVKGFQTKKIKTVTLGETFKTARLKKEATLTDAELATKVKANFLEAIEKNDWDTLPQEVYVRGFVLAYAKYLELPVPKMLDLYNIEIALKNKSKKIKISYNQSVHEKKVLITPKFLGYFAVFLFVAAMLSYIGYQVFSFTGNPNLKIFSPTNNSVTDNESVTLSGLTDIDTMVVVNSESVPVDNDGHFSLNLKLHSGVNTIKVEAINQTKKQSSETYSVEYKPKTASIENNINQ